MPFKDVASETQATSSEYQVKESYMGAGQRKKSDKHLMKNDHNYSAFVNDPSIVPPGSNVAMCNPITMSTEMSIKKALKNEFAASNLAAAVDKEMNKCLVKYPVLKIITTAQIHSDAIRIRSQMLR